MESILPEYTLLINSLAVPMQLGLYRSQSLVLSRTVEGQTSERLLEAVASLLEKYEIREILYVNGPGSNLSIKLTYIMLRSIEMLRGIPFRGVSGFALNGNKPIKAMGSLYFTKEKETIITQKFDNSVMQEFWLPDQLHQLPLEEENKPYYNLPAV